MSKTVKVPLSETVSLHLNIPPGKVPVLVEIDGGYRLNFAPDPAAEGRDFPVGFDEDLGFNIWWTSPDYVVRAQEKGYLEKPNGIEGYGIQISTISDYQLMLARMDANFTNAGENASSIDDLLLDSVTFAELGLSRYGIFHLDVTRAPGGNMTVYLNTTKVLSALDDTYTISDSIRIDNFNHEPYYDNIIVDDDYSFIPGLPLTTTTTSSNGENPTTTTTESSSPGFEVELVLLSLFLIFVFSRKRRL